MIHGCKTTHIFCLPPFHYDRRVLDRNRVLFASIEEAQGAGFRACKVCRPEIPPMPLHRGAAL